MSVLLALIHSASAANLLTNGGFETGDGGQPPDPAGWTEYGPDLTGERSLAYARTGVASAKRWTASNFQEYGYYQEFPCVPGREYQATAHLFSPANDPLSGSSYACIRLEFYSSSNQKLTTRESLRLRRPNGSFQRYSTAGIAPGGAVKGRFVYAVGAGPAPHGGAAWCDDAEVVETDLAALSDDEFLDLLQRRIFDFFWLETSPLGLIKDRADNFVPEDYLHSSIASVGFGLSAICMAEKRGWIGTQEALERVSTTLETFQTRVQKNDGFFHHFLNMNTGQPMGGSEISTIDTALLLFGALMAGEYFEAEHGIGSVKAAAEQLYHQVNWPARYSGWTTYSEYIMMDLLAMGSPTHPVSASYWDIVVRPLYDVVATRPNDHSYPRYFYPVLFVHQYPHCWIDFRFRHDAYTPTWTYFDSSAQHTRSNRQYCIDHSESHGIASPRYETYGPDTWGLTAGDGPFGYKAYGERWPGQPLQSWYALDGTVLPHAPGGSVMFEPEICISALRHMAAELGERIWGRYGFTDSFNVDLNWWGPDVIGIDLGGMFLAIENYRTGWPWRYFMRNAGIRRGLDRAGFSLKRPAMSDDFDDGAPNAWGGVCGGDGPAYVPVEDVNEWVGGQALQLAGAEAGGTVAICLNSLDLTYADEVTFWVKAGELAGSVDVGLRDDAGNERFVALNAFTETQNGEWARVVVPLEEFEGVHYPSVDRVIFRFGEPGSVLVDYLWFAGTHPDAGGVEAASIGALRGMPDGTRVTVEDVVVTNTFGGFFYVEEPDRSAGIRVAASGPYILGDILTLGGTVEVVDGERTFVPDSVTKSGRHDPLAPLTVQAGQIGRSAPELTGLYVRTWGRAGEAEGDEFLLTDAGGNELVVWAPALPKPPAGAMVLVTGAAGAREADGLVEPLLRVKLATDIVALD